MVLWVSPRCKEKDEGCHWTWISDPARTDMSHEEVTESGVARFKPGVARYSLQSCAKCPRRPHDDVVLLSMYQPIFNQHRSFSRVRRQHACQHVVNVVNVRSGVPTCEMCANTLSQLFSRLKTPSTSDGKTAAGRVRWRQDTPEDNMPAVSNNSEHKQK